MSSGGSSSQVVGYKYYIGMHMALCHGDIDSIEKIEVAERQIYPHPQSSAGSVVNGEQRISIGTSEIFGGEDKEGGISGNLDILYGNHSERNSYLTAQLGSNIPAFKGVCSAVLRRMYLSANNPYIKQWAFWVKRIPRPFYPEKAEVNGFQANPAHIIYETLTNPLWGAGLSPSLIDTQSFTEAADILHDEGFGLGIRWNQQDSVQNFIQIIIDHIGGVLDFDPVGGQFKIKLFRGDYDFEQLPVINEDTIIEVTNTERPSWGETVNEIVVNYVDVEGQDATVRVKDLGNIQQQNAVIYSSVNYSGIQTKELAVRVAERDLKAQSRPVWRCRFTASGSLARDLRPGDVFVLDIPDYQISNTVMRCMEITIPDATSTSVEVNCVQDTFALTETDYAFQEDLWEDITQQPIPPVENSYNTESSYWGLARSEGDEFVESLDDNSGYLVSYVQRPRGDLASFTLNTDAGSGYVNRGIKPYAFTAVLDNDIGYLDTVIDVSYSDIDFPIITDEDIPYMFINEEAVELVDWTEDTFTIRRGVIDTVPQEHSAGSLLYFGPNAATEQVERFDSETISIKHRGISTYGVQPLEDATTFSYTFNSRAIRPLAPSNFTINGDYYPEEHLGPNIDLSWTHRNRTNTVQLVDFTNTTNELEQGTTYNITFIGDGGVISNNTGVTGNSFTYPVEQEIIDNGKGYPEDTLTIQVESQRDGYVSWQKYEIQSEAYGYGMKYGERYGE